MTATDVLGELTVAGVVPETAVTIGVFDGVHIGHRHLVDALRGAARQRGLSTAVCFFKNHPRLVLAPGTEFGYLSTPEERGRLLKAAGVDYVFPLTFTQELSQLTAREFVALLVEKLRMRILVVGPDFALGKNRGGTPAVLRDLGAEMGYDLQTIPPLAQGTEVVSTTFIKERLNMGEVREAARLLGRPYRLSGTVVRGDQRGRTLGFPTANIEVPAATVIPEHGIYATIATLHSSINQPSPVDLPQRSKRLATKRAVSAATLAEPRYDCVTSIGVRPTFDGVRRTIETHILDFSADLYGQEIAIDLIEHQRAEVRFSSVDYLIAQMNIDVHVARELLAALPR